MSASLSVGTIVARIFPNGTRSFFSDKGHEGWPAVPDYPADLFAVAAYLLETAGAYHYLVPRDEPANWSASALLMDLDEHAEWVKSGQTWMGHAAVPELVTRLWSEVGKCAGHPVFVEHRPHAPPARWWLPAIGLLVIADEACADLGYGTTREVVPSGSAATSWVYDAWYSSQERIYQSLLEKAQAHITYFPQHSTVCMQADPDVVCVQPKSRTPPMGCTLRTFSHNLATLPPRGIVRACWQRPPGPLRSDDDDALNLLLIPYPFQISAQWFKGHVRLTPEDADRSGVTNYDALGVVRASAAMVEWAQAAAGNDPARRSHRLHGSSSSNGRWRMSAISTAWFSRSSRSTGRSTKGSSRPSSPVFRRSNSWSPDRA